MDEQAQSLVEQEFKRWREAKEKGLKREAEYLFANAWAKVAYAAECRMDKMGRELAKAQYRIGRQRKANRELLEASRERERRLKAEIQIYIDAEKAAAGPDMGTVMQSKEDACRMARIVSFSSVLYLIEEVAE